MTEIPEDLIKSACALCHTLDIPATSGTIYVVADALFRERTRHPSPLPEAGVWKTIESAPKDGTRVIVRTPCFKWSGDVCQHVAIGHRAVEASFCAGPMGTDKKWREWCGDEKTFSTDWIVAEAWQPLPTPPQSMDAEQEGEGE